MTTEPEHMPIVRPRGRKWGPSPLSEHPDCPSRLPFALFATKQARSRCNLNHGQTPERLAERGGLGPGEAAAILCDLDARAAWVDENKAVRSLTEIVERIEDVRFLRARHGVDAC